MTTTSTKEQAQQIARALLQRHLAGCVQIVGPITSLYWWEDEIEEAEEYLCIIKTQVTLYEGLESFLKAIHPYQTPEIIGVTVNKGSQDYLDWLTDILNRGRGAAR
ncbi:MAG: divalent-cation tolerance protein CutA [Anaerolineae bacterium]